MSARNAVVSTLTNFHQNHEQGIGLLLALLRWSSYSISTVVLAKVLRLIHRQGFKKVLGSVLGSLINTIPGAKAAVASEIQKEVDSAVTNMFKKTQAINESVPFDMKIPDKGIAKEKIISYLQTLATMDKDTGGGRVWAYVYETTDQKNFHKLLEEAQNMFMQKNALSPFAFPSLKRFENEVVKMTASMLNGDSNVRGNMTSGGTESVLMAIKTYRDRAHALYGITEPEMVLPITAHPAFEKAAHYFGVKAVYVPITDKLMPDLNIMRKSINRNTILLVGSAPQYPHGVVDPIEEISKIAIEKGLPLHVDACIGGFILPWVEKLGYPVPLWDFRVPGVTSISADVHKYGFAVKGASVIVYKNEEIRKFQFFVYGGWPGGLFGSPGALGTRGGGSIAAAWAAMKFLGEEGFLENAKTTIDTAKFLQEQISNIPGLYIMGTPHGTIVSFAAKNLNIFSIADVMEEDFGWNIERQQNPDCIHMTVMPQHALSKEQFVSDLRKSVEKVAKNPDDFNKKGTAAMYGMVAKIPSPSLIQEFLTAFLGKMYTV